MSIKKLYLGDGVYAELSDYGIILRTGSHLDSDCANKICMDSSVVQNFVLWIESLSKHRKDMATIRGEDG